MRQNLDLSPIMAKGDATKTHLARRDGIRRRYTRQYQTNTLAATPMPTSTIHTHALFVGIAITRQLSSLCSQTYPQPLPCLSKSQLR